MAKKASSSTTATLDAPATMRPEILTFKIVGMSPLLQNNPASFIGGSDDGVLVTKKEYVDEEQAMLRLYTTEDGSFYHPSESFIKAMVRAVTGKKFGKLTATSAIKGAVFIAEPYSILVDDKGKPLTKYGIDRRSVVVNKKSRILRCRPCFEKWRVNLALEVDMAILQESHVRDALALAGRIVGVGDYRPEKGGGFGRFKVIE